MPHVLVVMSGPEAGRVVEAEERPKTFGRGVGADVVIHDSFIADAHFALREDGDACVVEDLDSPSGTFVNGARVRSQRVHPGDEVRAGETRFVVRPESVAEVPEGPASPDDALATALFREMEADVPDCARWVLRAEHAPLYGVLDTSRATGLFDRIARSGERYRALSGDVQLERFDGDSPYLVAFPPDSPLLDAVLDEGWGMRWGVFLTSHAEFDALAAHLRARIATDREGEAPPPPPDDAGDADEPRFKLYDPRALQVALPALAADAARGVFGPVECFLAEAPEGTSMVRLSQGSDGAVVVRVTSLVNVPDGGV